MPVLRVHVDCYSGTYGSKSDSRNGHNNWRVVEFIAFHCCRITETKRSIELIRWSERCHNWRIYRGVRVWI